MEPSDEWIGRYTLVEFIGEGAHGAVWSARTPPPLSRPVAVKRLHSPARAVELERLEREAVVLAQLDHPNILRLIDVVTDHEGVALVTELAVGGSVAERLLRGPVEPPVAVSWLLPLAEALGSAHRRRVVHGDVKPANVLLTADDLPLLADFGLATWLGRAAEDPELLPGAIEGTEGFVAPEVLGGVAPTVRSDVYSFGVTAYALLTGRLPERGQPKTLLADRAVSSALHDVVSQAMSSVPAERFPSMKTMVAALLQTPEAGTSARAERSVRYVSAAEHDMSTPLPTGGRSRRVPRWNG